ncbi:MAG: hypothetical protein ABIH46_13545 [Chloroflexota bacterium]
MPLEISLKPKPVLDPRGEPTIKPIKLATRPSTLKGKQVLFFDNGKLAQEFGGYGLIFQRLEQRLTDLGVGKFPRAEMDLLGWTPDTIGKASSLVPKDVDAVVIALCDSGITQPTMLLARAIEERGLPAVVICTDTGVALAAAIAQTYVRGVPLCVVKTTRAATEEMMYQQADAIFADIVEGLTATQKQLMGKFSAQKWLPQMTLKAPRPGELHPSREKKVKASPARGRLDLELDPAVFAEEFYEACCDSSLSDGFPVIPPTAERVESMLRYTDRSRQQALTGECTPSGARVTVEKLAVNAVMAGCRPEYFPILITAFEAMAETRYRLAQAAITSHSSGNAVVISGPLAKELDIHSGFGCMGPGFRANATIGRAITLTLINVCRSIPGLSDLATFGTPAEYSYCFAENEAESPWPAFHTDLYDAETTTITVHRCESPHNIIDHVSVGPESLLGSIASVAATLGGNNAYVPAELLVFLNPEHARIIADAGWSKHDIKLFLYDNARSLESDLRGRGIVPKRPRWMNSALEVPVVRGPHEILVFVAGGAGLHSVVGVPWGFAGAVTRPVTFKDGRPVQSVKQFTTNRRRKM